MGWWRFLLLYLLSGIAGSAASVIGHNAVSAGASGALFGLIGLQLGVLRARVGSFRAMWKDPGLRRSLTWIGAWFVIGIFVGFDNYAHGGGLAFGLLFTWTLLAPPPRRWKRMRGRAGCARGVGCAFVAPAALDSRVIPTAAFAGAVAFGFLPS